MNDKSKRAPNVFAGTRVDRVAHLRKDPEWLSETLRSDAACFIPVGKLGLLLTETEPRTAAFLSGSETADLAADEDLVLLGLHHGRSCFAVPFQTEQIPRLEILGELHNLRSVGSLLNQEDAALLAYAQAMVLWHKRHRFCGHCGNPTRPAEAGHVRICTAADCGKSVFPRVDPAIIVLVSDDDLCLLGRQSAWPDGVFSTIAGFVEPGESLETAVAREVIEETGVSVADVRYQSSQPWPFPSS